MHNQRFLKIKVESCTATCSPRVLFYKILCNELQHPTTHPQLHPILQTLLLHALLCLTQTPGDAIFHLEHKCSLICTQLKPPSSNLGSSCLLLFLWLLFTVRHVQLLASLATYTFQTVHSYFPLCLLVTLSLYLHMVSFQFSFRNPQGLQNQDRKNLKKKY